MKAVFVVAVWLLSIAAVPVALAFYEAPEVAVWCSLASAFIASMAMFMILGRAFNSLMREVQKELEEVRKDLEVDDFARSAREEDFPGLQNKEVRRLWRQKIDEAALKNLAEGELFPVYRRILLSVFDVVEPYLAEEIVNESPSEILRVGNRTGRYSFRKFCRDLGR